MVGEDESGYVPDSLDEEEEAPPSNDEEDEEEEEAEAMMEEEEEEAMMEEEEEEEEEEAMMEVDEERSNGHGEDEEEKQLAQMDMQIFLDLLDLHIAQSKLALDSLTRRVESWSSKEEEEGEREDSRVNPEDYPELDVLVKFKMMKKVYCSNWTLIGKENAEDLDNKWKMIMHYQVAIALDKNTLMHDILDIVRAGKKRIMDSYNN